MTEEKNMLIELKAKTEQDASVEVMALSKKAPGVYFLVHADFGLVVSTHKRLPPQAVGDTPFDWYVLNGKARTFTEGQRVANDLATPSLS